MDKGVRSSFLSRLTSRSKSENVPSQALSTSSHKYESLSAKGDFIRLLKFKRKGRWGSESDVLQFDFVDAELLKSGVSSVDYYAVSYTWGSNPGRATIVLDGEEVMIPDSAEDALRGVMARLLGFRSKYPPRPIWIDAVCINQDDLHEKQRQIGMMGRVYAMAQAVFAWLGDDDGLTNSAFLSLKALAREEQEFDAAGLDPDDRNGRPFPSGTNLESVGSVMSCSWFTRLWVVQEVALSQQTIFVRGRRSLSWVDFCNSMSRLQRSELIPIALIDQLTYAWSLLLMRAPVTWPDHAATLRCALIFTTSNPWDNIYGMLGLLAHNPRKPIYSSGDSNSITSIRPDYRRDLVDVFREATWLVLERTGDLELIGDGQTFAPLPETLLDEWPSWVPRYHESSVSTRTALGGGHGGELSIEPHFTLDAIDRNVIRVQGLRYHRVKAFYARSLLHFDTKEIFLAKLWSIDRNWQREHIWDLHELLIQITKPSMLSDFGAYLLEKKSRNVPKGSNFEQVVMELEPDRGNAKGFRDMLYLTTKELSTSRPTAIVELTNGRFARVARDMVKSGDYMCILFGSKNPVVLRPYFIRYKLRGLAEVPGINEPEYVQQLKDVGRLEAETITFAIS